MFNSTSSSLRQDPSNFFVRGLDNSPDRRLGSKKEPFVTKTE